MKLTKINKNFQLIASAKNNLKIAEKQIVQGIYLQRREIDNEVRISEAAEMRRKFNRNQKRVTPWDIQLCSLILVEGEC